MNTQPTREFNNDIVMRFYGKTFNRDDGSSVTVFTYLDENGYRYELKYTGDKKLAAMQAGDPNAPKMSDFILLKSKQPVAQPRQRQAAAQPQQSQQQRPVAPQNYAQQQAYSQPQQAPSNAPFPTGMNGYGSNIPL